MGTPEPTHFPKGGKGERGPAPPLRLAAIGMEAEFELWVDGRRARPERVFRDPRDFLGPLMHRTGRSYALPNGAAVYFDTGVIEVATPAMEVARGVAARAGRSLWEAIHAVRAGLDDWERYTGRAAQLVGFSAHYNVSFNEPAAPGPRHTVEDLAWVLVHLLPFPLALVAANKRSTGVGVRPRGERVEITVDFTPSPSLTIAAGALIAGVVRAVMAWPAYTLAEAQQRGLPVLADLHPKPHTSRQGWLAHASCFPRNPFEADPDAPVWRVRGREERASLREMAAEVFYGFRPGVRAVANPFTYRLLRLLFAGHAPALLDLPDRPEAYAHVGRLCAWDDLFPERMLRRSQYERVLIRAVAGRRLRVGGRVYRPVGLRGWSAVRFRRDDGALVTLSVDALLRHLDRW